MNITQENRKWLDDFKLSHPLVIAGPCSAETEDQVLKIARKLKDSDVSILICVREFGNPEHVPADLKALELSV